MSNNPMANVEKVPLYGDFYNTKYTQETWAALMLEMLTDFMEGRDIFVEITEPKREGSIARVKDIRYFANYFMDDYTYRSYYSANTFRERFDISKYTAKDINIERISQSVPVELKWDGRRNSPNISSHHMYWLKGYSGPTNWVYEKPEVENITVTDRLGREVKVGDFIAYVLYHFDITGAGIYFGKVTKVTNDGTVWAKNIKLEADDIVDDKRIKDNQNIVIMTKDLMDQLMLARLSSL